MTHVFPQTDRLRLRIALVTQRPPSILNETTIGQLALTILTAETLRMPVGIHRLDHPPNDKLAAFSAAGGEQHVEVVFAVLAPLEFVENTIAELLEALRTSEIKSEWLKSSGGGWGWSYCWFSLKLIWKRSPRCFSCCSILWNGMRDCDSVG